MFNLKKNEDYVLILLERFKYLRDDNKSLSEKVDQKFPGQPSCSEQHLEGKLREILGEIEEERNSKGKNAGSE